MTFTIGTMMLEFIATGLIALVAGFLIGANWYKRKGTGSVRGSVSAEIQAARDKANAEFQAEKKRIIEKAKEKI